MRKIKSILVVIWVLSVIGFVNYDVLEVSAETTTDGYVYGVLADGTIEITGYTGTATELVIPSVIDGKSVTSIGSGCFEQGEEEESTITDIVIPDSVTNIGSYAFYGCTGLTDITIPESVTSIGEFAFGDCIGLTSITIPKNVTSIEDGVFEYCRGLTDITIPESVTSIGMYAFRSCAGLTNIMIPESVTSIEWYAFAGCSGLTSIKVDDGNPMYNSNGDCNAIIETDSDTLIRGCVNTIIPESVTSIGDYAFDGCIGLTSITMPKNVTSIGDHAFEDCTRLTDITIPESVTNIGLSAFAYCSGLNSITIPKNVTSIGDFAFEGCGGLTSIKVDDGNSMYNSNGNCNAIIDTESNTLIRGCVNTIIPESVISIGDHAFDECTELTDITIPDSVTSIGWRAFKGCTGLTDITIPESVTRIGAGAFEIYDGLKDVYVYNVVIHGYKNSTAQRYAEEYGMVFKILGEEEHTFSTEYTIDTPATCAKSGSKSRHCTEAGCTEKTDITVILATGNHTYDTGVMKTLPTCVAAGEKIYTCTGCGQTMTEAIAATGTHTFGEWVETKAATGDVAGEKARTCSVCAHQETETIPAMGYVKGAEFSKGKNTYTIKSVKGKKGTVIYEGTEKTSKKVSVPKTVKVDGKTYTVTEIAEDAFKDNTKITSVTIPEGVTKIGKNAFSGCKKLKTITIKSTKLKTVGKNAIKGIDKKATIKVPSKQLSKYQKLFKSSTGFKKTMKIKK